MKEKKTFKNKLILHLFYNLIAFSIILLIFGVSIFFTVKNIVYSSADRELIENIEILKTLQSEYS